MIIGHTYTYIIYYNYSVRQKKMYYIIYSELMAFDVKVFYCKKSFGQHFVDYLGPNYYNAMPLHIKKLIYYSIGNLRITCIKKTT